jgi:HD-GYP domain-containing protein (c-di-GMP phosphodiesterase class II)
MTRLVDLIRQGNLPEKGSKPQRQEKSDQIRIRDLDELKIKKDAPAAGSDASKKQEDLDFPSELTEKRPNKEAPSGLEEFGFPSEKKTVENKTMALPFAEKPLPQEKESFITEAGITKQEEEKTSKSCEDLHKELYTFLEDIFAAAKKDQHFSINKGLELVAKVLDTPHAIEHMHNTAIYKKTLNNSLATHGINVAIFAIMIGRGLGYERDKLIELGLAALIHDIGMCKIPEEIINKEGSLTNEEYAQIKKHPQLGYTIVANTLGEKYKWLAEVVSQEQEREKGQGYPLGLKGNEFHEYAKIIGMVDVYEALSHPRPQRKRFLPYEATKVIVSSSKDMFSPKLIKVLITKLSCFPIGSYVILNSKAIGRVVEASEISPFRPTIELLYDSAEKKLAAKKIVKLQDSPLLYIVDSLFEEDLPK